MSKSNTQQKHFAISQREGNDTKGRSTGTKYYLTVTAVNGSVKIEQKAGDDFSDDQLWSKQMMDEGGSGNQSFLLVSKLDGRVLVSKPGDSVGLDKRQKSKTAKKEELWTESKVEGVKTANNESYLYIHKPGDNTLVLDAVVDKRVVLSKDENRKKPKPSQCWEFHPWEPKGTAAKGAGSGASTMPGKDGSYGDRSSEEYTPTPDNGASNSRSVKNDRKKGQQ